MPNPYAPPGESSAGLWLERSNFSGEVLCAVAYGVHLTVFCICAYYLVHNLRHKRGSKNLEFLAFTFILFAMGTFILAGNTKFTEEMWIDDRNIPGGPNAWLLEHYNDPNNVLMLATYIIANFFADGMLLWRAYTFWGNVYVIAFPSLVFLGSTVMSMLSVYHAAAPASNLWAKSAVGFTIAYFSLSVALNIILTILIVGRLLYLSRSVKAALGDAHARTYTSIAAMMIESAAPFTICGVIFIITYGLNSSVQNLVLPVFSQVQCISPELIVLRVAKGNAWTSTTVKSRVAERDTGPIAFGRPFRVAISSNSVALSDITPQDTPTKSTGSSTAAESKYNFGRVTSSEDYV